MKKIGFLLLILLLLPLVGMAEAQDITGQCTFTYARGAKNRNTMRDQSYLTYYTGKYLEITMPENMPCHGVYLSFAQREQPYSIQCLNESGEWERVALDERCYANSYLALEGLNHFRIVPEKEENISIAEIHLLGEGEIPAWVQDWKPFEGKADLLVLSAHGDDELLFFGGVIPYYTGEMQKNVIVCYLTDQTSCRRNELLDGLWTCGVRSYPSMGVFKDTKNDSLAKSYDFWGKSAVIEYVTSLVRKYQPEVMVTHDIRGEYGHGAHRVCADAGIQAFSLAADENYHPELGETWQLKKLYLHLYKENALVMDWRQPLSFFDGKTAFDVAKAAFACHVSQQSNGLIVQDWGDYANNRFGLYATMVGLDVEKKDLFENIGE